MIAVTLKQERCTACLGDDRVVEVCLQPTRISGVFVYVCHDCRMALISALQAHITLPVRICASCGQPEDPHDYRHPFKEWKPGMPEPRSRRGG
jgi:hypothetical protein